MSLLLTIFAIIPYRSGGKEGLFSKKVLLKLSSKVKLRNFDIGMKIVAVAPHRWFVQPVVALYITFGVCYCFIHSKGNAKT